MSKKLLNTLPYPKKDIYIYALKCPVSNVIKYVGLSTTGIKRMEYHYKCGSGTKIKCWIVSLRRKKQIFNVLLVTKVIELLVVCFERIDTV